MTASKSERLRVGVIGLGRLWESRHKPALARLSDRFRITAVHDQVAHRAAIVARQIGCAAPEGLDALIDRADVDAVYLLSPQWFGLHPIHLACARGKAIYCALPLAAEPENLDHLAETIPASGVPFMPELARRFYPATLRLQELLATKLGRPRLILGHCRLLGFDRYGQPGPTTQLTPMPIRIDPGSYLLDWCRFLFQGEPTSIQGFGGVILPGTAPDRGGLGNDFESFTAEFAEGAMAQISVGRYHHEPWSQASRYLPQPGFQVFAERGAAWLELPDRIQWTDAQGSHDERLPLEPTLGEVLNNHFHRLVHGEPTLAPTLHDALAVARLVNRLQSDRGDGEERMTDSRSRGIIAPKEAEDRVEGDRT